MKHYKIPREHYVSPVDGSLCRLDIDAGVILDKAGNTLSLDEVRGTRKLDAVRKYLKEKCV